VAHDAPSGGEAAPPASVRVDIQERTYNGRQVLALVQHGPGSEVVIYLAPDAAITVGGLLVQHGQRLRSGLILPPSANGHG
jgi:hypothetical protein